MSRPSSPEELAQAVATLARGGPVGLLFDYDGTLTEIAPRPEDARLSAHVRASLATLAALPEVRLAVLTGRSLEGLRAVAGPLPGVEVAANGGFHVTGPTGDWVHPEAARLVPLLARHARTLAAAVAAHPGTQLEDKALSLAVHYRRAPEAEGAMRAAVAACLANAPGVLRLVEGKAVLELQPALAWDKGRALDVLCDRWGVFEAVLFVGDDVIDEPGFAAARARGGLGCRVAAADAPSFATMRLSSVPAVHALLERLAALLGG